MVYPAIKYVRPNAQKKGIGLRFSDEDYKILKQTRAVLSIEELEPGVVAIYAETPLRKDYDGDNLEIQVISNNLEAAQGQIIVSLQNVLATLN